jgi:hypothetical protein
MARRSDPPHDVYAVREGQTQRLLGAAELTQNPDRRRRLHEQAAAINQAMALGAPAALQPGPDPDRHRAAPRDQQMHVSRLLRRIHTTLQATLTALAA